MYRLSSIILCIFISSVIIVNKDPSYYWVSNVFGYLLLFVHILEISTNKKIDLSFITRAHIFFLFFIAWCSVGFIISGSYISIFEYESIHLISTLIQILLLSFIVVNIIINTEKVWPVTVGVLSGLFYATAISWDEFFVSEEVKRVGSTLDNPNSYAFALLCGVLLLLYNFYKTNKCPRENSFIYQLFNLIVIAIFSFQIVFFTGSRKGVFILLIVLLFSYMSYIVLIVNRSKAVHIIFAMFLVPLSLKIISMSVHYERIENLMLFFSGDNYGDTSLEARASMVTDAVDLWSQKPFMGWGLGQFRFIANYGTYSHSNVVELLANVGLIGLLIYYLIHISIFYDALSIIKINKKISLYVLSVLIALVLWDIGSVTYYSKLHWIILSTIIGLIKIQLNADDRAYCNSSRTFANKNT